MKKLWYKWLIYLIKWHFEREYRFFNYSFEDLDEQLKRLKATDRDKYLDYLFDIKSLVKNIPFNKELGELKKLFYKELAISSSTDIERAGYRLSLLFIRKLERRIIYLSGQYYLEEKLNRRTHSLDQIYEKTREGRKENAA